MLSEAVSASLHRCYSFGRRDYYEKIGFNPASATAEWGVTSEVGQYYVLADGNTRVP